MCSTTESIDPRHTRRARTVLACAAECLRTYAPQLDGILRWPPCGRTCRSFLLRENTPSVATTISTRFDCHRGDIALAVILVPVPRLSHCVPVIPPRMPVHGTSRSRSSGVHRRTICLRSRNCASAIIEARATGADSVLRAMALWRRNKTLPKSGPAMRTGLHRPHRREAILAMGTGRGAKLDDRLGRVPCISRYQARTKARRAGR